jgi:hypothetical protein
MRNTDTERVRAAADIVKVVGGRVRLRKAGSRYTGLCPFHAESTPSFSVNPSRQRWHCFGCGTGGDVFDFVSRIEGVGFVEARRGLAELAGIAVDDRPLTPAERAAWAAEQRALERELPAARLWRQSAICIGYELLTLLKAAVFDPTVNLDPEVGEIAEWERRLARWRTIEGAHLVGEYRKYRQKNPEITGAMVQAGALHSTAETHALRQYVQAICRQERAA